MGEIQTSPSIFFPFHVSLIYFFPEMSDIKGKLVPDNDSVNTRYYVLEGQE